MAADAPVDGSATEEIGAGASTIRVISLPRPASSIAEANAWSLTANPNQQDNMSTVEALARPKISSCDASNRSAALVIAVEDRTINGAATSPRKPGMPPQAKARDAYCSPRWVVFSSTNCFTVSDRAGDGRAARTVGAGPSPSILAIQPRQNPDNALRRILHCALRAGPMSCWSRRPN